MFSFFKKGPLHGELKRAKKVKRLKDKLFWKENDRKFKENKRIKSFIDNDICPECGKFVKLKQTVDETDTTDNHYICTNCPFEKHYYCDDEDFE